MSFQLTQTKIKVEDTGDEIIFSNLVINQYLADVNDFTFTWRQEEGQANLSNHVKFYKANLSKTVTINIGNDFTFKGIIYAINCNNQDSLGVSYDIIGKGLFVKLDEVPECNSFIKKDLTTIFKGVNTTEGTILKTSFTTRGQLFYTVQYNQTNFEFMRMMAARYGEWFYYNGTEMVAGPPAGTAVELKQDEDIFDVDISAKLVKAPQNNSGFDQYKGEKLNGKSGSQAKGSGIMAACISAGENAFGNRQTSTYFSNAVNTQVLKDLGKLNQQATAASSVVITAQSYNNKIKLGGKIKLKDEAGGDAGEYIVTEIHHRCMTAENYRNQFFAIPAENEVPPYTDPQLFTVCKPQPGIVVSNEDNDGLDRIKVHFPWQKENETTPWISVLTPHAGKNKGIRFLPELDEEVLIGFIDNNAERPFVMGAVHTDRNKSGNAFDNNNLKIIGTKTGRRLEIDDDKGDVRIADNFFDHYPQNVMKLHRKDSDLKMFISSLKDEGNGTSIAFVKDESLKIQLFSGNSPVTEIILEKNGKKIIIKSGGTIELKAEGDLSLSGNNIKLKAMQEISMEGTKGVNIKGTKVAIEADATMDITSTKTTVEGKGQLELKGGGMASLNGGIVKIN